MKSNKKQPPVYVLRNILTGYHLRGIPKNMMPAEVKKIDQDLKNKDDTEKRNYLTHNIQKIKFNKQ